MKRKNILLLIIFACAAGGGWILWQVNEGQAKAARTEAEILKGLSAAELSLILKSQAGGNASAVAAIGETAETRKLFLDGMEEYLALAAEARREGLADDSTFKANYAYKKNQLLADLYRVELAADKGDLYVLPADETTAVWNDPAAEKQFAADMETLHTIQTAVSKEKGDEYVPSRLQGGSLSKARENWARTKVLSDKAKADAEFMKRPEIELRYRVLEAGILSADLLRKHWGMRVRATDAEIEAYLASHPEYDLKKKLGKAESVLQRAKAGEDFAVLTAEFSEHRPTKSNGGLFEKLSQGEIWPELETAALSLENGQVSPTLVKTEIGYHIVKLENTKTVSETNGTQHFEFSIRHILFQHKFEQPDVANPNIPPPFMTPQEIAKMQVERAKRNAFVAGIVERNQISLPDDFSV